MSHQVLSPEQFASQRQLPVEASLDKGSDTTGLPQAGIPEKEDQDVGQQDN